MSTQDGSRPVPHGGGGGDGTCPSSGRHGSIAGHRPARSATHPHPRSARRDWSPAARPRPTPRLNPSPTPTPPRSSSPAPTTAYGWGDERVQAAGHDHERFRRRRVGRRSRRGSPVRERGTGDTDPGGFERADGPGAGGDAPALGSHTIHRRRTWSRPRSRGSANSCSTSRLSASCRSNPSATVSVRRSSSAGPGSFIAIDVDGVLGATGARYLRTLHGVFADPDRVAASRSAPTAMSDPGAADDEATGAPDLDGDRRHAARRR